MAKNNRKVTIAIIGLMISIVVIIAAIVKTYASIESEVKYQAESHTEKIETIKTEGCLPARQSKTDIQIIKADIETIKKVQTGMDGKLDELLKR